MREVSAAESSGSENDDSLSLLRCDAHSIRTGLFVSTPAFHGSTALLQVLIGTGKVATTCSAEKWVCEERMLLNGTFWRPGAHTQFERLAEEGRFFNLSKDVFLISKLGLIETNSSRIEYLQYLKSSRDSDLPEVFVKRKISGITPFVVMMYRPFCLRILSSHGESKEKHIRHLRQLLLQMRMLLQMGISYVVLNYGDFLYQYNRASTSLSKIPCVEPTDLHWDFSPTMGVHVYQNNKMKTHGATIDSYGAASLERAKREGYDISIGKCMKYKSVDQDIANLEDELHAHLPNDEHSNKNLSSLIVAVK